MPRATYAVTSTSLTTMSSPTPDAQDSSIIGKMSGLLALYVVYVFVSGWAFNDYYYRFFGVDPKFLDINLYDILTRGFTILFAPQTRWLSILYIVVIAGPLFLETALRRHFYLRIAALIAILLPSLVLVYLISRSAGEQKARRDQGDDTTLPTIIFLVSNIEDHKSTSAELVRPTTANVQNNAIRVVNSPDSGSRYTGQLLFYRGDTYFIHHVIHMPPSEADEKIPHLSIFKGTELKDVKIIEHQ